MSKFSLAKKLLNHKKKIEIEIPNLTEEELNSFISEEDEELENYIYDPSLDFRKEVSALGYWITKLISVYYQGWECDEWACIAKKDGVLYHISTNHGGIKIKQI